MRELEALKQHRKEKEKEYLEAQNDWIESSKKVSQLELMKLSDANLAAARSEMKYLQDIRDKKRRAAHEAICAYAIKSATGGIASDQK